MANWVGEGLHYSNLSIGIDISLIEGAAPGDGRRLCENAIGFFEGLPGADVVPHAGNCPRIHRHFRIEPLDQPAGLVGVVAFADVLTDKWHGGPGIVVESDACESAGRLLRFLLKKGNTSRSVDVDGVVFFDLLEVA